MNHFRYLSFFLVVWSLFSCRKAADEIPSYIACDSTRIISTQYGEPNSSIYGFHITVEADDRGTWQIPFLAPILKEGIKSIIYRPIVKVNNLSTLFIEYPLYKLKILDLNLVRGKTIDSIIGIEYLDSVKMTMYESMETKTNFSGSERSSLARNGNYSMVLKADFSSVDSSLTSFYYKSITVNPSKETYMEFDYYMPEGVLAPALAYTDNAGNTKIALGQSYLNPNTQWTHVYWQFTPTIIQNGLVQVTPVFIITPARDKTTSTAYLDNIKILEK